MDRLFCQVLNYAGCRPSEALELSSGRVLVKEKAMVFRSLKKRRKDSRGRIKQPQFPTEPVPEPLIEYLDLVYSIRTLQKKYKGLDTPLWTMSRPTAYRLMKRVMIRAGINGKQTTGKRLRHRFGVAMVTGKSLTPVKLNLELIVGGDVNTFAISSDSSFVAYRADADTDGVDELYLASIPDGATMKLNSPLPGQGKVSTCQISPSSTHVVYIADQNVEGQKELYAVEVDVSSSETTGETCFPVPRKNAESL